MPVVGFPESYELVRYARTKDIRGGNESTYEFTCLKSDLAAVEAIFLYAGDGNDPTLTCTTVTSQMTSVDASGVMTMKGTAKFVPKWKLDALTPDQPFLWRYGSASQSFTLKSELWTWESGEPVLNTAIKPLMNVGLTEVVLYGTRSVYDSQTFAEYVDKVNSDYFCGAPPGYVMYQKGASGNPRQLDSGVMVYDVEIPLVCRYVAPWNYFFNETTGIWELLRRPDLSPMYTAAPFAPLLAVP
jgi:hypothetical protein